MSARTLKFKVEVTIDRSVTEAELRDYIFDAVTSWGGQFHPDDPLFGLADDDVSVVRLVAPRQPVEVGDG